MLLILATLTNCCQCQQQTSVALQRPARSEMQRPSVWTDNEWPVRVTAVVQPPNLIGRKQSRWNGHRPSSAMNGRVAGSDPRGWRRSRCQSSGSTATTRGTEVPQ